MIIGILGTKSHGKDTIANYISDKYDFQKEAFANPLKDICKILFGFNENQLYGDSKEKIDKYWGVTPRHILQFVGTELFRREIGKIIPGIGDNFWIKSLEKKIESYSEDNVVISDIRFQNEVDMVHKLGGIVIKVFRENVLMEIEDIHISELEVESITNYDLLIKNNGNIYQLYMKIDDIMKNKNIMKKIGILNSSKFENCEKYILGC